MNRTTIDWPNLKYTWNPITGCKNNCEYCYARRIHERFYKTSFRDIICHENRLNDPSKVNNSTIFVGSMSDIWFWNHEDKKKVVETCEYYFSNTYMFLSKNPGSYIGVKWPKNTMQGVTETLENSIALVVYRDAMPRPYFSVEPIMGPLKRDCDYMVIVGAMTGNMKNKVIPKREWIDSIIDHVSPDKIWWKDNIRKQFPDLNNNNFNLTLTKG